MIYLLKGYTQPEEAQGVIILGKSLLEHLNPKYTYHCKEHTLSVKGFVDAYIEWNRSGKRSLSEPKLTNDDCHALKIAAVFHDLGFLDNSVHNEGIAISYAMAAMRDLYKGIPAFEKNADFIRNAVAKYILTTARYLNPPPDKRQAIILDADMVHVGAPDPAEFLMWNKRLRDEYEALDKVYTHKEWLGAQVAFLSKVKFRTAYAKEIGMDKNLKANIKALKDFYKPLIKNAK